MDGFDVHQAIGGPRTCRQLAEVFYARVKRDPVLRPLFPGKTLKCAIEEFSAFLVQLTGGPAEDTQRRWWVSLRESHLRFRIGQRERDAWMTNMVLALDDVPLEESARSALRDFFARSSAYIVNGAAAEGEDGPPSDTIQQELSRRWSAQRVLDEAIAAVRSGAAERAIALAGGSVLRTYLQGNHSVFAALLAQMIINGNSTLLDYVRQKLVADPGLAHERFGGRTLLHDAAAAGNVALVELLMCLGADPDIKDDGGHTPLYRVANHCKWHGANVVRALVDAGARVDACDGVKHCTALHMAARRDNVEVAGALLDCGAGIEMRDSLGETPLRRAVNLNNIEVAALLLERGADMHSTGSKGLTPVLAARSAAMRQLFQSCGQGVAIS
ncbi:MAG TPA: ankyrin repeat domain-containing protein [Chloroflexota bacterium]